MKQFILIGFLAVFAVFSACNLQNNAEMSQMPQIKSNLPAEPKVTDKKMPVLVELFTSEGCSSCPPADRVLTQLEKEQPNPNAEIITLALHVDYWDSLSWKDEYSSAMFSQRQTVYGQKFQLGSIYTPQMVVDGQTQFVGSNLETANKAITDNAKNAKATIELANADNNLKIKISDAPKHENATVFLAITEDNLASNVRGGENSGKKLEHTSIVRELKSLGMLSAEQKNLELENALQIQPNWKRENLKFVVFVQENASRKILGVNRKSIS